MTVLDTGPETTRRAKEILPRPPQVYVLALGAALAPLVALFAPAQFAALLLILGVLVLVLNPVTGFWPLKTQLFLLPLAALLIIGVLSGLWAVDGAETSRRAGRLAAFLAAGVLLLTHARELKQGDRRAVGWALTAGFALLILLFVEERLSDKWLLRIVSDIDDSDAYAILNRPGTLLALLSWPAAGFLWSVGRRGGAVAVFVLAPLALVGDRGQAGILALGIGWLAALPAMILPRTTRVVGSTVVMLIVLVLPIAAGNPAVFEDAYKALGPRAYGEKHRLLIWHFTGERIAERPLLGWGLDSARIMPGGDRLASDFAADRDFRFIGETTRGALGKSVILPLHPHNAILQIQLELGIAGLVSLAAFMLLVIRTVTRTGPWMVRACRMGLLTSAATIASMSYGIWQSWWVAALFLMAVFGAALPDKGPRIRPERDIPEKSIVNPPAEDEEDEEDKTATTGPAP